MFVTFEGPEGAGKSTAVHAVAAALRAGGRDVLTTREPGAGAFGAGVRNLLLHGEEMPAASELFLFLADRANHVDRIIRPALARGEWVLCDRYADSTFVYQAAVRGLDPDFVRGANRLPPGAWFRIGRSCSTSIRRWAWAASARRTGSIVSRRSFTRPYGPDSWRWPRPSHIVGASSTHRSRRPWWRR